MNDSGKDRDLGKVSRAGAQPSVGPDGVRAADALSSEDFLEQEKAGLLFRWREAPGRGRGFALLFFVALALLVHVVGIYLFKVTAPVGARLEAQTAQVTMLDPADANTAALLREVDDRLVFLRPASQGTASRLSIEDYSVTFEPSFLQRRVPFRPPSEKMQTEQPFPELLPKDGLVLPPVTSDDPRNRSRDREHEAPETPVPAADAANH